MTPETEGRVRATAERRAMARYPKDKPPRITFVAGFLAAYRGELATSNPFVGRLAAPWTEGFQAFRAEERGDIEG